MTIWQSLLGDPSDTAALWPSCMVREKKLSQIFVFLNFLAYKIIDSERI